MPVTDSLTASHPTAELAAARERAMQAVREVIIGHDHRNQPVLLARMLDDVSEHHGSVIIGQVAAVYDNEMSASWIALYGSQKWAPPARRPVWWPYLEYAAHVAVWTLAAIGAAHVIWVAVAAL